MDEKGFYDDPFESIGWKRSWTFWDYILAPIWIPVGIIWITLDWYSPAERRYRREWYRKYRRR